MQAGVEPVAVNMPSTRNGKPGLSRSQSARLVEANEELVRSAMHARSEADDCARLLETQSESVGLDPLTALPNRILFLDRLTQAIAHARRHGDRIALLFLDLDNFKQVNDALGHGAGDEVLKLVAHRIVSSLREGDTVSRHGGDEFLALLTDVSQASDAVCIAEKLLAALVAPIKVGGHVFRVAASIGVSLYPDDGQDVAMLIERADAAMYRAKRSGHGGVACHGEPEDMQKDGQEDGQEDGQGTAPHALELLQGPSAGYGEQAAAEYERRLLELRDANQQLVLSALDAQHLLAAGEQARARQKEFLAVTAHELRNPLSSISLASTMLAKPRSKDPARMQAIIERQVTLMERLIEDMLDLSRVHTGKLRLERRKVDLAGLIDEAVFASSPAMNRRKQKLSVRMPPQVPELDCDPVRLAQVFNNLLDNASKYTPEGGRIGLVVELLEDPQGGDSVVITISDSGIGISAEAMPSVFEPFVQDSTAIGFSGAGLGIGLTVVRELVEAHGGTVTASSEGTGRGSQFVVTLPLPR